MFQWHVRGGVNLILKFRSLNSILDLFPEVSVLNPVALDVIVFFQLIHAVS